MLHIDKNELYDKAEIYLYGDIEGRNEEVVRAAQAVWDKMQDLEENCYFDGEIAKVLNFFKRPSIDDDHYYDLEEEPQKKKSPLDKVRKADAVFLAMHFGFLYGLIYAENSRLHYE